MVLGETEDVDSGHDHWSDVCHANCVCCASLSAAGYVWRADSRTHDGQEEHLVQLGKYIDQRVRELVAAVGQVGDSRLLVMVSLLIADELADTYADLKTLREVNEKNNSLQRFEDKIVDIINGASARIETANEKLSKLSIR